jgi:hypothetical protein
MRLISLLAALQLSGLTVLAYKIMLIDARLDSDSRKVTLRELIGAVISGDLEGQP